MNLHTVLAFGLAFVAHLGQKDRAQKHYFGHIFRVYQGIKGQSAEIEQSALLHDTVEDTWVTLSLLHRIGFCKDVVEAVNALSRREEESYAEYLARCKRNLIARKVKISDLHDNMSESRLQFGGSESLNKRYRDALSFMEN